MPWPDSVSFELSVADADAICDFLYDMAPELEPMRGFAEELSFAVETARAQGVFGFVNEADYEHEAAVAFDAAVESRARFLGNAE